MRPSLSAKLTQPSRVTSIPAQLEVWNPNRQSWSSPTPAHSDRRATR
ncbi:unnamed protein product [Linum tenue]|uniref:Uncharacterized protein n=1 Tax=Linum tenue TaxID=586396 RepID=A0AAV0GZM3_9ROSI|nr:unnamed protein product [Linum tenue]